MGASSIGDVAAARDDLFWFSVALGTIVVIFNVIGWCTAVTRNVMRSITSKILILMKLTVMLTIFLHMMSVVNALFLKSASNLLAGLGALFEGFISGVPDWASLSQNGGITVEEYLGYNR